MTTTPEQSEMGALLERVLAATGADRELDAAIHVALSDGRFTEYDRQGWVKGPADIGASPAYTASLDAALALVERALPGKAWTLGQNVHHWHWVASINYLDSEGLPYSLGSSHAAPTPALALLAALLTALTRPDADPVEPREEG